MYIIGTKILLKKNNKFDIINMRTGGNYYIHVLPFKKAIEWPKFVSNNLATSAHFIRNSNKTF